MTIQLNGTALTSPDGMTNVTSLGVYVDRRNAPPPTNTTYGGGFDGGPVTLPEGGTPGNLRLRALIDNSLIEVGRYLRPQIFSDDQLHWDFGDSLSAVGSCSPVGCQVPSICSYSGIHPCCIMCFQCLCSCRCMSPQALVPAQKPQWTTLLLRRIVFDAPADLHLHLKDNIVDTSAVFSTTCLAVTDTWASRIAVRLAQPHASP